MSTQITMYQQPALALAVWAVVVAEEEDGNDGNDEDKGGRRPGKMTHTFTVCRRVRGGVVTVPTMMGRRENVALSRKQLREALKLGTVASGEVLLQNQRHQAQQQQQQQHQQEVVEEGEELQEPEMLELKEQLEELQIDQEEEEEEVGGDSLSIALLTLC
ncbi:hypothetical protein V8C34DRAFT_326828 [Trichoderma compactum]